MKKFKATAKDRNGNRYAGIFEAENEADAKAKLKAEGYLLLSLEEVAEENDPELYEKLSPKKFDSEPSDKTPVSPAKSVAFTQKKRRPTGLLKLLFAAAVVLALIPFVISLFSPDKPDVSAEDTVKEYFSLQSAGDFSGQWKLLSDEIQAVYLTPEKYAAQQSARVRQNLPVPGEETPNEESENAAVLGLTTVAPVYEEKKKAEFTAFLEGGTLQQQYLVRLRVEGSVWKILTAEMIKSADISRPVPRAVNNAAQLSGTPRPAPETGVEGESSRKSRGLEEMRAKALQMLDTAYQQGKLTKSEYLKKKQSLGEVKNG